MPTQDEVNEVARIMQWPVDPNAGWLEQARQALLAAEEIREAAKAKVTGPCLRTQVEGTRFTWTCDRCIHTWTDRRETDWRPYQCRLSGTPDIAERLATEKRL